jgi:hypothetical protein
VYFVKGLGRRVDNLLAYGHEAHVSEKEDQEADDEERNAAPRNGLVLGFIIVPQKLTGGE